mmetsp:Transcript_19486/g.36688  ORF Transcript_19486/g.36688 Transcript_19486/m.36688 type:complete len:251 (-) Transcript_19486:342-1094(-)
MSQVSVGVGYDFTQDGQQYATLFSELASPRAPEYYPGGFSPSVNSRNLQRLGRLNVTNRMMETTRDDLIQRTMLFVGTVEVLRNATLGLDAKVSASRIGLLTSVASMERLVKKVLEFNRESPCGLIGEGYNSIVVGTICKTTYLNLEAMVPGIIVALLGILLGFTVLVVMRDCAVIDTQLRSPRTGSSLRDTYAEEGKVDEGSMQPASGSRTIPLQKIDRPSTASVGKASTVSIMLSRPTTGVGSAVAVV